MAKHLCWNLGEIYVCRATQETSKGNDHVDLRLLSFSLPVVI